MVLSWNKDKEGRKEGTKETTLIVRSPPIFVQIRKRWMC